MFLPRKSKVAEPIWDGVLNVPFDEKDAAKALGARWDSARRLWVVPPELHARREAFAAWDNAHVRPTHTSYAAKAGAGVAAPSAAAAAAAATVAVTVELQRKRDNITHELARAVYAAARSRG